MADEIIRDFGGRIIARIETKPNGDKIVHILGRYDKAADVARDFGGHILARGECLGILIGKK